MQGVRSCRALSSDGGVRLELTPTTTSPLAIDVAESAEMRIQRLISENPVVIFARPGCCMCHVMKSLLFSLGVHPTVIGLDQDEEVAAALSDDSAAAAAAGDASASASASSSSSSSSSSSTSASAAGSGAPAVFIGGARVGGLERLVGLHLSGRLVPKLKESGALPSQLPPN